MCTTIIIFFCIKLHSAVLRGLLINNIQHQTINNANDVFGCVNATSQQIRYYTHIIEISLKIEKCPKLYNVTFQPTGQICDHIILPWLLSSFEWDAETTRSSRLQLQNINELVDRFKHWPQFSGNKENFHTTCRGARWLSQRTAGIGPTTVLDPSALINQTHKEASRKKRIIQHHECVVKWNLFRLVSLMTREPLERRAESAIRSQEHNKERGFGSAEPRGGLYSPVCTVHWDSETIL